MQCGDGEIVGRGVEVQCLMVGEWGKVGSGSGARASGRLAAVQRGVAFLMWSRRGPSSGRRKTAVGAAEGGRRGIATDRRYAFPAKSQGGSLIAPTSKLCPRRVQGGSDGGVTGRGAKAGADGVTAHGLSSGASNSARFFPGYRRKKCKHSRRAQSRWRGPARGWRGGS